MKYRKLGRTKLKVSVIGIGGGAFKGEDKTSELIKKIVEFGVKRGINLIETAEDYGEEKFAPSLSGIREKVILISKSFSPTRKEMEKSIENSLRKLKTDKIDVYMLHTVNSLDALDFMIKQGSLDALRDAKKKGLIDHIGISGHRIHVLMEAIKTDEFDVVEVPYSIGSKETEKLLDVAKEYDVGVIAIRCFGGGILVDRDKKVSFMNVENALAYVLSNQNISTALVGVSSVEHLKECIRAVDSLKFSKIRRSEIERKVKEILGENFCRGCLACMPCEIHGWKFPIDQLMRMWVYLFKYKSEGVKQECKNLLSKLKCEKCGRCEKNCPYGVAIVKKIEELEKVLGD